MKTAASTLILASVAAADYGYGYAPSSSSSSSKIGYTTIYPGYGAEPVTVTKQYQAIPTYTASSWSEYPWVSTVVTDCDGQKVTVTKYDQPVTVYHTKSTITNYKTETIHPGYPAPTGGYGYVPKNATTTTKAYYELYEKVHEVKYNEIGPKVLPGYPGSPLNKNPKSKQPVKVKEYTNGQWSEFYHTFTYGEPKPSATTFAKPGTYTLPASDVTVEKPSTAPAEATQTCKAGKPVTYGGVTTTVTQATTVTVPYGAYQTHGTKTKTVIKYKTVTCPSAGNYEVIKPTTTVYDHDTKVTYPTTTYYAPGVYHHPRETVTITKSNQAYTCSYSKTQTYPTPSSYPVTSSPAYPTTASPAYPTVSKDAEEEYPVETPSATADPSADYPEPTESYGTPYAGYVKRGGMLQRRSEAAPKKALKAGKRVILV